MIHKMIKTVIKFMILLIVLVILIYSNLLYHKILLLMLDSWIFRLTNISKIHLLFKSDNYSTPVQNLYSLTLFKHF